MKGHRRKIGRACVGFKQHTLNAIRDYARSDAFTGIADMRKTFDLTQQQADTMYLHFRGIQGEGVVFGHKAEAYWTEEQMLNEPKYSVDELKGEELEILNTIYHGQREQA